MPSPTTISLQKFSRLVGTPKCPAIDRCPHRGGFRRRPAADPRLGPPLLRRSSRDMGAGPRRQAGRRRLPEGPEAQRGGRRLAPPRRRRGRRARGRVHAAWAEAGLPLVAADRLPPPRCRGPHGLGDARPAQGRPHRLSLADPALRRSRGGLPVRRAVGGGARSPSASAPRPSTSRACSGATAARPAPSTPWSPSSASPPSRSSASPRSCAGPIPRRPDLAPQAAGLLAVSLGLSRLYSDDLRQLEAGMGVYDALYLWCRDAVDEAHNWPSAKGPRS